MAIVPAEAVDVPVQSATRRLSAPQAPSWHPRWGATDLRELELARQIQRKLVPNAARFGALEVAALFEPCSWVGGDYVDAVPLSDGRVLLVIADVCGKGLQAALVASSLHTLVHEEAERGDSLAATAARMNGYLGKYLPPHSFVTLAALAIDGRTGDYEHVNAGHPPAIVLHARGGVSPLASACNVPLGMISGEFATQRGRLGEGDALLMYTDGLFHPAEAPEAERVARIAAHAAAPTAHVTALRDAIAASLAGSDAGDDRALLVAKRAAVEVSHAA